MLPSLHDAAKSMEFNASGSFLDGKGGAPHQTTSDILFLKRLLFLKASLDNDAATLSNFAVPFEEDNGPAAQNLRARAGFTSAPSGERPGEGLDGTSPARLEPESDGEPLMLTNGGVDDQPRRLGAPGGMRSHPRTAGQTTRPPRGGGSSGPRAARGLGLQKLPRSGQGERAKEEPKGLLNKFE